MNNTALATMETFDEASLPDLDICVLGALEFFTKNPLVSLPKTPFKRPLVVGSGNAAPTGRILFDDTDAFFADESDFRHRLAVTPSIDGVVLISASGGKHAISIAQYVQEHLIGIQLFTHNSQAPAKRYIANERVIVFRKSREPYTYNTSTYLGLILAKTEEDPAELKRFIIDHVHPKVPDNFGNYSAFTLVIPKRFTHARDMLRTKFDELFGPMVAGRVFTEEEAKHAKTVVSSEKECCLAFGEETDVELWGNPHSLVRIPLPDTASYSSMIAVGYYVIGRIQAAHPPYFKQSIGNYVAHASKVFGHTIPIIVE